MSGVRILQVCISLSECMHVLYLVEVTFGFILMTRWDLFWIGITFQHRFSWSLTDVSVRIRKKHSVFDWIQVWGIYVRCKQRTAVGFLHFMFV